MSFLTNRRGFKTLAAGIFVFILLGCSGHESQNTLPETFIGVPVAESAVGTQNELIQADHIPQDRYDDAVRIQKLPPEAFQPEGNVEPTLGDRTDFFINYDLNNGYRPMPATLRHISGNALWWVADNASITDEELATVAENFENITFKINRLVYGTEEQPGIDGENRIHFVFVDMPEWEGFYGYFSTTNTFPRGMEQYSNEKDMMVINIGSAPLESLGFAAELGHEFAHLIQWSVDPNEDLWMNEALAELSAFLVVSPPPGSLMEEPNMQVFATMPYIQLTSRPELGPPEEDPYAVYAHYGGEKLFTIYLLDRFGPQFIKDLINNQEAGTRALDQELGKLNPPLTFNELYADWILANLLNQPDHPEGRFGYAEVQTLLPSIILVDIFDGEPLEGYMPPYATFYYELRATDKITLKFDGASMARLTPADPMDGEFAWYSNRGDQTAFSLTRSFDLTSVKAATLNYSVWYELEEDFDYGYVLVSDDDGKTWTILPTKHGRAEGLSDGAFGMAYTGESVEWRDESLDLSAYAGKKILIRFLVNTDLATNRDGLMLDNIAIPEIDFFDGAENADGGWATQGFVRSGNVVPVEWIVWLVKVNIDPDLEDEVIRLELDDLRSGSIEVDGFGKTFDFAALVVSPTAPTTTMSIDYELSITGK